MPNLTQLQTSFAAGEIDPQLIGRTDLRAYADGAARLRNVWVTVGGGVKRRAGFRHVAELTGGRRLAATSLTDGRTRLFVLLDAAVVVLDDETEVASLSAPWREQHLPQLSWATHRGNLFVCHPSLPPQHVVLEPYGVWRVLDWTFDTTPGDGPDQLVRFQPYAKYAAPEASLEAFAGTGPLWTFTSNQRVFDPSHVGTRLRFKGAEVAITSVAADRTTVMGIPQITIDDPSRTFDWEEQAFSPVAGYPAACIVYRERLVAGGVPAAANRLWLSKVGRPFNFDTGSGLDDEAIGFALGDDPAHAIRAFSAGRELEIFTSGSEWTVDGNPLAPASTFAIKQTGIGSYAARQVPPVNVDGASLFVGRGGNSLIEYTFTEIDTAYQAQDLAVRARHLISQPTDLAFDVSRRLVLIVDAKGELSAVTLDRNAQMVAWSRHRTDGEVRAVTVVGDRVYAIIERQGTTRLERLDDDLTVDAAVRSTAMAATNVWTGLEHLEGAVVTILGDGVDLGTATVVAGTVTAATAATDAVIGLSFEHDVEPLPLLIDGRRRAELYRPVQIDFQLHDTAALDVDLGEGLRVIDLGGTGPEGFTGTRTLRARGWRRGDAGPLWRITGSRPLPFQLLSATSDVKVTR